MPSFSRYNNAPSPTNNADSQTKTMSFAPAWEPRHDEENALTAPSHSHHHRHDAAPAQHRAAYGGGFVGGGDGGAWAQSQQHSAYHEPAHFFGDPQRPQSAQPRYYDGDPNNTWLTQSWQAAINNLAYQQTTQYSPAFFDPSYAHYQPQYGQGFFYPSYGQYAAQYPMQTQWQPVNAGYNPTGMYHNPHITSALSAQAGGHGQAMQPAGMFPGAYAEQTMAQTRASSKKERKKEKKLARQQAYEEFLQQERETPTDLANVPRSPPRPTLQLLPRPTPSPSYLERAQKELTVLSNGQTRRLLVILDLNGTLLHRTKKGGTSFTTRPHVVEFLHYLFTNHKVMIWSSAKPENVNAMVDKILTKLQRKKVIAVWGRDKLRLSPQHYNQKVQVYKQLEWVWRDTHVASTAPSHDAWAQDNTVLIDDSEEKAASEPHNLLKIEEFEGTEKQKKVDVLGQVVQYLEVIRTAKDVSVAMREVPYYFRPEEGEFDWDEIFEDMITNG